MKFFNHYIVFIFFLLISCGNLSEEINDPIESQNSTSLFGNKKFEFPRLSENAREYITHWGAYEDFESEAKSLNGSTVEGLRDKTERLISRIDSLTKMVPDTLKTQPIISRVMVAKTRASLLRQEVHEAKIDSTRLEEQVHEMNMATKNLIIQINEKFLKDDIDFQRKDDEKKELEKQKRFLDSVYQSELSDQKSN
jgi:hypothetical protein